MGCIYLIKPLKTHIKYAIALTLCQILICFSVCSLLLVYKKIFIEVMPLFRKVTLSLLNPEQEIFPLWLLL